jgi:hypothetical protein
MVPDVPIVPNVSDGLRSRFKVTRRPVGTFAFREFSKSIGGVLALGFRGQEAVRSLRTELHGDIQLIVGFVG